MRKRNRNIICWGTMLLTAAAVALLPLPVAAQDFTEDFRVQDCTWKHRGGQNVFFPLKPGRQSIIEGEEEDDGEVVTIRVEINTLNEKQRIRFEAPNGDTVALKARVWEEREFEDGELVEVSRNFLAICRETGDIFYFGEDVEVYEDGELVGHPGEWQAGVDGAQPGILFPGRFLLGARYMQEIAPGVALDRAKNVAMGLEVPTPAGNFSGCVGVLDSNALEPDAPGDPKVYCPRVGLVMDEDIVLIERN
jgi:hypothetical protein